MILVTGATGHVGAELITQLVAAGHKVRAMTRRPDAIPSDPDVEVVRGDATDPTSLAAAFAGITRAFLMSAEPAGSTERPTHVPRLVEAASGAGVEHVVLLSVYSGGSGGDVIAEWSRRIEDSVTSSGLAWTMLRPGRFMSNALQWIPQIRAGNELHIPFATRPAASIDPADIAAVAATALVSDPHHGAAYQLTGPDVLTPVDEVAVLATLLGRPLRVVEPPIEQVRDGLTRAGLPAPVVDAIFGRTRDSDEGTVVLPTVAELLGRPAGTFDQWARRHVDRFIA